MKMAHHTITREKVLDWQRRLREAQAIVSPVMREMEDAYLGGTTLVTAMDTPSDAYQSAVGNTAGFVRSADTALEWLGSDEDISPFVTLLKRVEFLDGEA